MSEACEVCGAVVADADRHEAWHFGPGDSEGVAGRLNLARAATGMSFGALAEVSGVSKAYLVRITTDEVPPNLGLDTIVRIAGALGVQPAWLAFGAPGIGIEREGR